MNEAFIDRKSLLSALFSFHYMSFNVNWWNMIKQSASRLDELDIKNNSSANAKWLSNVVEKMSRFRSIYQNYPPSAISRNLILNSKKNLIR